MANLIYQHFNSPSSLKMNLIILKTQIQTHPLTQLRERSRCVNGLDIGLLRDRSRNCVKRYKYL